jgi:hypothetical protein
MKEADIFESWAARLVEGTWALPDTPEKMTELKTWFSQPQPLGPDAENVTDVLYPLLGDDALFDQLAAMAEEDPDADAIPIVQAWVTRNRDQSPELSELAVSFETAAPAAPAAPVAPAPEAPVPAQPPVAEGDNLETFEDVIRLSGAPINENVLNDTGSTLDYIIKTYQRDVKDFVQNSDMSELLYDALYDYYQDDMPYGIKKARTGDPYEWIGQRFYDDLQGLHMVDENLIPVRPGDPRLGSNQSGDNATNTTPTNPPTQPTPAPVNECNYTMENRYCPVHGLEDCGTMGMFESELARIKSLSSFK